MKASITADLDDDTGQIAALTGRKGRGEPLVQRAAAGGRHTGIDPGRANLDEHLPIPDPGLVALHPRPQTRRRADLFHQGGATVATATSTSGQATTLIGSPI
jgi:hypothetical protein